MLQTIEKVEYLSDYKLKLHFDNGKIRVVVNIRDTGAGCELYGRLAEEEVS